jgi:hypothetical protein
VASDCLKYLASTLLLSRSRPKAIPGEPV